MMAVPIVFGDDVIGVIFLDDIGSPHVFTTEDAEISMTFAHLAAVAITFGPGDFEQAHTVDEHIAIADVVQAAEIYARATRTLVS